MVSGAAAHDAVQRARTMPHLRVGLHLCWWRKTVLPAMRSGPGGLIGTFRTDMAGRCRHVLPAQVRPNWPPRSRPSSRLSPRLGSARSRQCPQAFPSASHHRALIVKMAKPWLKGARVPLERRPCWAASRITGDRCGGADRAVRQGLQRRFRRAGITAPDSVFGLACPGDDAGRLAA